MQCGPAAGCRCCCCRSWHQRGVGRACRPDANQCRAQACCPAPEKVVRGDLAHEGHGQVGVRVDAAGHHILASCVHHLGLQDQGPKNVGNATARQARTDWQHAAPVVPHARALCAESRAVGQPLTSAGRISKEPTPAMRPSWINTSAGNWRSALTTVPPCSGGRAGCGRLANGSGGGRRRSDLHSRLRCRVAHCRAGQPGAHQARNWPPLLACLRTRPTPSPRNSTGVRLTLISMVSDRTMLAHSRQASSPNQPPSPGHRALMSAWAAQSCQVYGAVFVGQLRQERN